MSAATAEAPEVLHALPGRLRLHLPEWSGKGRLRLETRLRALPGVRAVQASAATRNALLLFDPAVTDEPALIAAVGELRPLIAGLREDEPPPPSYIREKDGQTIRARICVNGLDRDPDLGRRVVERLQGNTGVRARANPLTGRVLVEFREHEADLNDLIAQVAHMELPDLPGEDRPVDPLDPKPFVQSLTRTIGAALGVGLLAAQQAPGLEEPIVNPALAAQIAGIIGIIRGFPLLRNGLRRLFGRDAADLALTLPNIVTLALSNSPLGLATTGLESVTLLNEVRARQAAWRRYEERLEGVSAATPGAVVRMEAGERTPLAARVIEGKGTAMDRNGLPAPVEPGGSVAAGARLFGGPFVLEMEAGSAFLPQPRPAPVRPTLYDRYVQAIGPISLTYAALTAILTRSPMRTFAALLLVNPRTAVIGLEAADLDASARVLRAGVTIVGSRPVRSLRRPDALLLDGPRLLSDRLELASITPLMESFDTGELAARAGAVAAAAGSPWGGVLRPPSGVAATNGHFDGTTASAEIGGVRYTLGPVRSWKGLPPAARLRHRGDYMLLLRSERTPEGSQPLGLFALRPQIAPGVAELVETCRRHGVALAMLRSHDDRAAHAVAKRACIPALAHDDALAAIRSRQERGEFIAFVSDGAHAAAAFDACDLAIGLTDGRNPLAARADLVAPDLEAVAAVVEAGARRDAAVRDAVGLSIVANMAGAIWGFRGMPGIEAASRVVYATALAALADGWLRLRGGARPRSTLAGIVDPRPERWGRQSVADALGTLNATEKGLTSAQAAQRLRSAAPVFGHRGLLATLLDQLRSPLYAILGIGGGLALLLGAPADVGIIGATIGATALVGAWQERRADRVAEALQRLGAPRARVLRDGRPALLPATDVVPGDVLLLGAGDRVTADARLLEVQALEVDEAALTGESLPVVKAPDGGSDASRIVLDGSDVTTGSGRAVVVAVGRNTRMGSIAAALAAGEAKQSPLDTRLSRLIGQIVPIAVAGGAIVTLSGFVRTRMLTPQLAIGATIALSAMPEGLPLLTQASEAGVARRLADRNALTRRLPAVEALGRVDVACADKTGTLTQGRLALRLVADLTGDAALPDGPPPANLRAVLRAGALASPHPDAPDAAAHPTDVAVTRAAEEAGLGDEARLERETESPFDPVRSLHAAMVHSRLYVKGAPEALASRCACVHVDGQDVPLDDALRAQLLDRAQSLAERGLRVLMVAEGPAESTGPPDDPHDLVALGFLGISDPLKPTVRAAVRRCREAGVRVIMLTGDHPATARAIAREAGLLDDDVGALLTGDEVAELENGDLDRRLERATVIARATPLDKVRIVESLQRGGHVVAMTGDGVNDGPALRLADVGVAMGRGGTEVARQTADVVLADDDFATLVETFVEGRGFWRNMRRAIGLLLGGNLGELGLVVGATTVGLAAPLTARQILIVNMITDILPGLAVALQQPEHRHLASLAREGASAFDAPLRNDVFRRGALTAGPSLAAYLLALGAGGLPQARTVAFASIVGTQLAQTLDLGWSEGKLTPAVVGAVGGSAALLGAAVVIPPLRAFLGLALPTPVAWALIGGASLSALLAGRLLAAPSLPMPLRPRLRLLPAPAAS